MSTRRNGYGTSFSGSQKRVRLCSFSRASISARGRTCFCGNKRRNRYGDRPRCPVASGFRRNGYVFFHEVRPCAAKAMDLAGWMHRHRVSGIMRIPRAGPALGWPSRFHHSIRMNSISTAPPWGAGILLRVASPHGGRASGEPSAGRRRPAMTLHNKRRQPE